MLDKKIQELLHHYRVENQTQIATILGQLKVQDSQIESFNQEIDSQIRIAFRNIMQRQDFPSLCSLLDLLSQLIGKSPIKKSVVINMLDNVLECVGVTDLKQVLDVIRDRVGNFGKLQQMDQYKLLRIINTLLKRISKTQDFELRGELQMSLTKILTLCHDSGFHNRNFQAKTEEINEDKNSFFEDYKDPMFTLQFFQEFWEIQRYFMNISTLMAVDHNSSENFDKQLLSSRLNRIVTIINQTVKYFHTLPCTQVGNIENFPLKFMKLPNLLSLQFSDPNFRSVIMIQCLLFCHNLKNLPGKSSFSLNIGDKEAIGKIEQIAEQQIRLLQNNLKIKDVNLFLEGFFRNQKNWIELKDTWREKKKTMFKDYSYQIKQMKRKLYSPNAQPEPAPPEQPSVTAPINLKEKMHKYRRDTIKKIGVQDEKMGTFLKHSEPPNLKTQPTFPSFSYFFSQAESCHDSFDFTTESQIQFDRRADYNLFEWKAFRSLYRQNLQDFTVTNEKNMVFKDYKLLNFMRKKQNDFYDEPRKRVKPNEQNPQE